MSADIWSKCFQYCSDIGAANSGWELCVLPKCLGTIKLTMKHNDNITIFSQQLHRLDLEKSHRGFKLIHLLIWLSLVSAEHLGLIRNDMTKYKKLQKTTFKKRKVSYRRKQEARQLSPKWNSTIVETVVILLMNSLSLTRLDLC